jgi:hypothetical protein
MQSECRDYESPTHNKTPKPTITTDTCIRARKVFLESINNFPEVVKIYCDFVLQSYNFRSLQSVISTYEKFVCNLWLAPTQQRVHHGAPAGFIPLIQLWSCNHTTASSQRTPAGFIVELLFVNFRIPHKANSLAVRRPTVRSTRCQNGGGEETNELTVY